MTRIFLDTNIVIDFVGKRQPFYQSAAAYFELAYRKEIILYTSALTLANAAYILGKQMEADEVRRSLLKLLTLVNVTELTGGVVEKALRDGSFHGIEDGMQYVMAKTEGMDAIITRDANDFAASNIPVFTPLAYLNR